MLLFRNSWLQSPKLISRLLRKRLVMFSSMMIVLTNKNKLPKLRICPKLNKEIMRMTLLSNRLNKPNRVKCQKNKRVS